MYIDDKLELSDAQTMASLGAASSVVSEDVIDVGTGETDPFGTAITPDIGESGMLIWHLRVNVVLVGASASITATLVTKAADASLSSGATTLLTQVIPKVSAAGTKYQIPVPHGSVLRYLGNLYIVGTASKTVTSGAIDSFISMDRQNID
jgi:hypothetical protein